MRTAERRSKENTKAMESRHNLEMSRIKQVFTQKNAKMLNGSEFPITIRSSSSSLLR